MQKTRRQHTVPRCYLARFCKDGKTISAFDKGTRKSFTTNAMNVAQQRFFYDLPLDLLEKAGPGDEVLDPQCVEKAFAHVEGVANPLIGEIIETAETRHVIRREHRLAFAPYVVVQMLRTTTCREQTGELLGKHLQEVAYQVLRRRFPDIPKELYPTVEYNKAVLPFTQAKYIFDEDFVVGLCAILNSHVWFVAVNSTDQPFYTSDNPVAKTANVQAPRRSFTGLRSPGIEIVFPLSSRHALVMLERTHWHKFAKLDDRAPLVDAVGVERINRAQVMKAHRQVYCEGERFALAQAVCEQHPEVCPADRERVRVVRDGDTIGLLTDG